jgi:hypothetical protein
MHIDDHQIGGCEHCRRVTFWHRAEQVDEAGSEARHWEMVYPSKVPAPEPNIDLPPDILNDYNEAAEIVSQSPRGAAALLRLAVQKLCIHLGYDQKDIDKAIGAMVKDGLSPAVQKAMDVVRMTGNEAVHPGTLDIGDGANGLALRMFGLVNLVAQQMITNPREADELFAEMPQPKQDGVAQRDRASPSVLARRSTAIQR